MNNIDSNTGEIVMYQPDETIRQWVGGHPVFFSAAGGNSQKDFRHPYFGIPPQLNDALIHK